MAGIEKTILDAIDRPLDDKDPDGYEPRRPFGDLERDLPEKLRINGPASEPRSFQEHKTGPKGVLADYNAGYRPSLSVEEILARDEADQLADQDDFLSEWRRKRMQELQSTGQRKTFGHFREIGLANFERAVLEEDPAVKVVLHLFEAHLPACLVLNLHLSNLAREYPHVKFLRAQASELDFASGSEDVLPTILVYQEGDLIANLVAVDLAWDRALEYDQDAVAAVLVQNDVLPRASLSSAAKTRGRSSDDSDHGDSD